MATENVTLTYPNGQGTNLLDYFALGSNYAELKLEGETKQQFMHRMIKRYVFENIKSGKALADAEAARLSAIATIDSTLQIT